MSFKKINHPLLSIQYLRALAALMVVFHHVQAPQSWLFNPFGATTFGVVGVDIFFVISGFIMYTAARVEKPSEFIYKRIIRIVPLYWLATLGFLALLIAARSSMVGEFTAWQTIFSLLFIPHLHPQKPEFIWPLLVPGWTLNFEMFFYLIFAVGLWLKRLTVVVATTIAFLIVIGILIAPTSAIGMTYTSPLLAEFLAGFILGVAFSRVPFNNAWIALPVGIVVFVASEALGPVDWVSFFRGVVAILIVAGALGLESINRVPDSGIFKLLGGASYSIYLSHVLTIHIAFVVWKRLPVDGWVQFVGVTLSGMAISMIVGIIIYKVIEMPLLNLLRSKKMRRVVA